MLSVIMLSVVMLNVVILSVVAPFLPVKYFSLVQYLRVRVETYTKWSLIKALEIR